MYNEPMPKYIGNPQFKHDSTPCLGVLLTNLGTPDAPTTAALRRYLGEFLWDPRVIEVPRPAWWLILHGIILRLRPRRSAKSYREIWTNEGSPLLSFARKQAHKIQVELSQHLAGPVKVELGMRYGNPSLRSALEKLYQANAQRILLLPLYPQYSATTTASTFDAIAEIFMKSRWLPELRMISHYHDDPGYINALADSIRVHQHQHGRTEKLLFSFHGIPEHYFLAGDPYHCECRKTARLVAEKLELKEDEWLVTFQSRFGPREWLQPYTDETLQSLAEAGTKSVSVICPGFSSDCLETLEEINIQYRARFTTAGGEKFTYIPALNDSPSHIRALTDLILRHVQGWPEAAKDYDAAEAEREATKREKRARIISEQYNDREKSRN